MRTPRSGAGHSVPAIRLSKLVLPLPFGADDAPMLAARKLPIDLVQHRRSCDSDVDVDEADERRLAHRSSAQQVAALASVPQGSRLPFSAAPAIHASSRVRLADDACLANRVGRRSGARTSARMVDRDARSRIGGVEPAHGVARSAQGGMPTACGQLQVARRAESPPAAQACGAQRRSRRVLLGQSRARRRARRALARDARRRS